MSHFLYINNTKLATSQSINASLIDLIGRESDYHINILFSKNNITKEDLKDYFEKLTISVINKALAQKILDTIFVSRFENHTLSLQDATELASNLLSLLLNLEALDVSFVCCNNLNISYDAEAWIKEILIDTPININNSSQTDILAAAFLKVVATNTRNNFEYIIKKVGVGKDKNSQNYTESLLCESSLPKTSAQESLLSAPQNYNLYEITILLDNNAHIKKLLSELVIYDPKNIFYSYGFNHLSEPKIFFKFLIADLAKKDVFKILFKYVVEISFHQAALLNLSKKLVALEVGTGNKKSICRFYEYIHYDQIIKTKILKEDLLKYAQEWDESLDEVSEKLFSVYKKWRNNLGD